MQYTFNNIQSMKTNPISFISLDSIDTQSGLVASDPIQKALIQKKYTTVGQVMVVPIAKPIRKNILNEYNSKGKITINEG